MNLKPFDLEAARMGEPIVRYYVVDGRSIPLTYIGRMRCGLIVTEDEKGGLLTYDEAELRMAPVPVTLYVVTWWYRGKPLLDPCYWFAEKVHAETYVAGVKSKYGEPGNKWDHPVITAVEVSE